MSEMKFMNLEDIVEPLMKWYKSEKRDLPWRHTDDPYKIWISEIMLQQTRVEAVKSYYLRFVQEIPTLKDLANVDGDRLLKLWEGLGYYSRAKNLKKCASVLIMQNKETFPPDYEELKTLPGIGPYTAAAIGSIAFHLKTPAIDGNVLRIMARILEDDCDIMSQKVRKNYFDRLVQIMPENTRDFTEGLIELGALVCVPNGMPKCETCPIQSFCQSYQNHHVLDYPKKKKKEKRKIEEKTIIIFEYKNRIAIRKRANQGLLASLYEFYNLSGIYQEKDIYQILNFLNVSTNHVTFLGKAKHIFSHIEWHMNGYYVVCNNKPQEDLLWVTKKEFQKVYSLPSAFSYFAKKLNL